MEIAVDVAKLGDPEAYVRWKQQALDATAMALPLADFSEMERWRADMEEAEKRKAGGTAGTTSS